MLTANFSKSSNDLLSKSTDASPVSSRARFASAMGKKSKSDVKGSMAISKRQQMLGKHKQSFVEQ